MAPYDSVLDALGDPTRRSIVAQLRQGPATVGVLADRLPVSRPAVSQHLKILRGTGLVSFEPDGASNRYRLEPAGFDVLRIWLDALWSTALDQFAEYATTIANEEDR